MAFPSAPALDATERSQLESASWIWAAGEEEALGADHYVCFRRSFDAGSEGRAVEGTLEIAAETDYIAFLNGVEVGRGQFSDFPRQKTWSRFILPPECVQKGGNVLAILVHYRGVEAFDHQAGFPGLIAALRIGGNTMTTNAPWRAKTHPAYRSFHRERMTVQCGLTFLYDARNEEPDWTAPHYDDSGWPFAKVVQETATGAIWHELLPRPLQGLALAPELPPVRIVMQGALFQTTALPDGATLAEQMRHRALRAAMPEAVFANPHFDPSFPVPDPVTGKAGPDAANTYAGPPPDPGALLGGPKPLRLRPAPGGSGETGEIGHYFILDLGAETVGLLELEIEAPAGTVLDLAHGEHLADGRVRMRVGVRNFADRYVCREGRQHFQMPFRRLAARYLEVHVLQQPEGEIREIREVHIHRLGLRPASYPIAQQAEFEVEDPLATRLHTAAVRTLDLCRHEHYEDCPWREQALYGYDSRLQALYGYYAFGDTRFPEVSFSLLGQTCNDEGFLALIAPGQHSQTIPVFSFAWIAAVAENWLYSGSPALFQKTRPAVETIIRRALSRPDAASGLYHLPCGSAYWHFYEWTPGLAGETPPDGTTHHAPYSLHLHEALRHYAWMLRQSGLPEDLVEAEQIDQQREALGQRIHHTFWNAQENAYATYAALSAEGEAPRLSGRHELVQTLALHEGIAPESIRAEVVQGILSGSAPACTLSASYYLVPALLAQSQHARAAVVRRMLGTFEEMIFAGATTLWETAAGERDFDFAGSLCHGWSALPVYLHHAVILGVTPLEPGFRRFAVRIHPSRFAQARGSVITPLGPIRIAWQRSAGGLELEIDSPAGCEAVLLPYPETPYQQVRVNGELVE